MSAQVSSTPFFFGSPIVHFFAVQVGAASDTVLIGKGAKPACEAAASSQMSNFGDPVSA
jgi:hypothetical protein